MPESRNPEVSEEAKQFAIKALLTGPPEPIQDEPERPRGKWFPPFQVQLRFCSVCGANDRYRHLNFASYHFGKDGKRCPGSVETVTYDITEKEPGDA